MQFVTFIRKDDEAKTIEYDESSTLAAFNKFLEFYENTLKYKLTELTTFMVTQTKETKCDHR